MDLFFCSDLPSKRRITSKDHKQFDSVFFDLNELSQLQTMNKEELLGLMAFCQIRIFNHLPILACSEDEMRLAYCVWRGDKSKKEKKTMLNMIKG